MCNNIEGQFKKQVSDKFEQFLRIVENIYFEISLKYSSFTEMIREKTTDLLDLEEQDYMAYIKKLINTNKDLIKKNQDIEANLKQISRIKEKKINDLDGQIAFQTIYQLQNLLAESKKQNETLTRRLRIMCNYNEKSINQKINDEDENFECICGGTQIKTAGQNHPLDYIRSQYVVIDDKSQQSQKSEKKMSSSNINILLIQQLLLRALKSRQIKITNLDDDQFSINFTQQEIKDLEMILTNYFSSLQKYETIQTQNKKYQQQVITQQTKIKELEISNEYREDQFVESETFSILQIQNNNLIDINSQLTQSLQTLHSQYQELINTKQFEIGQLKNTYEQEIQKLSVELSTLKKLHSDQQFGVRSVFLEKDQLNQNLKERYEQAQRIIEAQNGESHALKATNKELRNTLDELAKANQELSQKNNDLDLNSFTNLTLITYLFSKQTFPSVDSQFYISTRILLRYYWINIQLDMEIIIYSI